MHRTPRGSFKSANGSMANSGWDTTHSNINARHVGLDNTDLLMEAAKGKKQLRFVRLLFGFCSGFVRLDGGRCFSGGLLPLSGRKLVKDTIPKPSA